MTKYTNTSNTLAAQLVEAIHDGVGEWHAPWHHTGGDIWNPTNAVTGQPYRGSNWVTLALTTIDRGYTSNRWATYKQWAAHGGQVRRGEVGTPCFRWVEKNHPTNNDTDNTDEDPETRRRRFVPVGFVVFNPTQVDQYDAAEESMSLGSQPVRHEAADATIEATGARIVHCGDSAFYRPSADLIQLPTREQFTEPSGYYATVFHELGHWTGHPDRDTAEYAIEELVAELTAAMLCGQHGIANPARSGHATYIAHCLEALNENPTDLFRYANRAQAAADYINQPTGR